MEKYEKPVMVLEEIVDEIHTAVAYPDAVVVSGEPVEEEPQIIN